ncbi:uncharacterized protein PV09_08599 [Verruconis gallopava]|uniref:Uncharacterized protein n=1 Tax=Verruconis gallopava TaxID=253628 RepID=A0A0D2A0E2_9PEZI|nr:uncharacterized protein PV09_08599 [Verruconis gallopava]KIV99794.1 hypothetical protein PV09_08599 [Verruconis gallopava]
METASNSNGGSNCGQVSTVGPNDSEGTGQMPDIDRILAELAGYSASKGAIQQAPVTAGTQAAESWPSHDVPQHAGLNSVSGYSSQTSQVSQVSAVALPPAQPHPPLVDPSTIFEWPQALRCVNKLSASNPQFGPKIKQMIVDQDNNVKQWWQNRNGIIANQKTRNEGIRGLNAMLKGVGGQLKPEPTPEENKAELDRFDLKVYNASQQMAKAHAATLKALGVPFFGVDPKHIVANELQQAAASRNPLSEAKITEKELLDLQRKMLQYLEDLYRD